MMKDELRRHMKDYSTKDAFCFAFICSSCGTLWRSKTIPFSRAGEKMKEVVYEALYRREWKMAQEAVLLDAINHFSICPICHGMICDHCFLICNEIEMCKTCAERLHESGKPVIAETAVSLIF
mgnify:CR=1 FL=1